jgi:hypothetical protein
METSARWRLPRVVTCVLFALLVWATASIARAQTRFLDEIFAVDEVDDIAYGTAASRW